MTQNTQLKENDENLDPYEGFKEALDNFPFVIIIGKYDHVLGPRALYSSIPLNNKPFI